jgi:hypothetical protein
VDPAAGLISSIGLLVMAVVLHALEHQVATGTLERNGLVGIRTRATMTSDEAWRAGHSAANPRVRAAAYAGYGFAAVAIVSGIVLLALDADGWVLAVPLVTALVGYAASLALLLLAAQAANRAARRVEGF